MRREILNAIRAWMGSQCSCFSVGVMWSLGLRSLIRRAAVCITEDRGCSVESGSRQGGEDRVAVVESGDDESLNQNTTACFVNMTKVTSDPCVIMPIMIIIVLRTLQISYVL